MPLGAGLVNKRHSTKKFDEFYTLKRDIENEVLSYPREVWDGKTVYLPCDSENSNFFKVFLERFSELGLKKLIASSIEGKFIETTDPNDQNEWKSLDEEFLWITGDFRSPAVHRFWEEADIIVTNPPFSLFGEFFGKTVRMQKSYLMVGYSVQVSNKRVTREVLEGNCRIGNTMWLFEFEVPNHYEGNIAVTRKGGEKCYAEVNCLWYTNLPSTHPRLENKREDLDDFIASCDRFEKHLEVIRINYLRDIPSNYKGVMAVPITFLRIWNEEQFEILGLDGYGYNIYPLKLLDHKNGEVSFRRFFIRLRDR